MDYIWKKRNLEVCIWGLVVTAGNMWFQFSRIWKPMTFEDGLLASIYMMGSFASLLSFILYFKKKADTVFVTLIYISVRQCNRLYDFE